MKKRYILTGTPGSGKTSVLRQLETLGYTVIEEAATDVIALEHSLGVDKPWEDESFIIKVLELQKSRQSKADFLNDNIQFFDRSPICTYALCKFLKLQPPEYLINEIKTNAIYNKKVFFLENLGFIKNTEARQIGYKEALEFEKIHYESYTKFGYEIINIPSGDIITRAKNILIELDNNK